MAQAPRKPQPLSEPPKRPTAPSATPSANASGMQPLRASSATFSQKMTHLREHTRRSLDLPPILVPLRAVPELQLQDYNLARSLPRTVLAHGLWTRNKRHPALCARCEGTATSAWWVAIVQCAQELGGCRLSPPDADGHRQPRDLCTAHRCPVCDGLGVRCPRCHGDSFVREPLLPGPGSSIKPCSMCHEGTEYSVAKMLGAYKRLLGYTCAECGYERAWIERERALLECPQCQSRRTLAQVLREEVRAASQRNALPAAILAVLG